MPTPIVPPAGTYELHSVVGSSSLSTDVHVTSTGAGCIMGGFDIEQRSSGPVFVNHSYDPPVELKFYDDGSYTLITPAGNGAGQFHPKP